MDTPGFSSGGEAETLNEIKRGIELIQNKARFVGVLYFSKITERIQVLDEKLRAAVLGFCGPSFIPQITFVTTFWTPVCDEHGLELNEHLKQLKQGLLTEFVEKGARFYEHGREFPNANGAGEFLNWYKPDDKLKISAYTRRMVLCRYIEMPEVPKLRFVQELEDGASALETEAARALGLYSNLTQDKKKPTLVSDPQPSSGQTGSPPLRPDPIGGTSCSSSRKQSRKSSHSQEPEEVKEECKNENKDESKVKPKNESKDGSKKKTNKESKKENRHGNARDDGGEKSYEPPWWQGSLNTVFDLGAKIVVHAMNNSVGDNPHGNFASPPLSSNASFSQGAFTGSKSSHFLLARSVNGTNYPQISALQWITISSGAGMALPKAEHGQLRRGASITQDAQAMKLGTSLSAMNQRDDFLLGSGE